MSIEAYFKADKEFKTLEKDVFKRLGVSYIKNRLEDEYFVKNSSILFGEDDHFCFSKSFDLENEFCVYIDSSDSIYRIAYVVRKSNQYVKVGNK